jgi:hypothetical protein
LEELSLADPEDTVEFDLAPSPRFVPPLLAPRPPTGNRIALHSIGSPPLHEQSYAAAASGIAVRAGGSPAIRLDTIGLTVDEIGWTWTLGYEQGDVTLYGHGADDTLMVTRHIRPLDEGVVLEPLHHPAPLHVHSGAATLVWGRHLLTSKESLGAEAFELPSPAISLCGASQNLRPRLAMAFEEGGAMVWRERRETQLVRFGADMSRPALGFLRAGWLIAADKSQVEVYQTGDRQLSLHGSATLSGQGCPIAVVAHRRRDEFALVFDSGQVLMCEVI